MGSPATNDLIIRDLYALSNNDSTKFADWVAYRLDNTTISGQDRNRTWGADPWLDEDETLEPEDFSGAFNALDTDRGHQAPLGSLDGPETYYETNFLSNITPQQFQLNRFPWRDLETRERRFIENGVSE